MSDTNYIAGCHICNKSFVLFSSWEELEKITSKKFRHLQEDMRIVEKTCIHCRMPNQYRLVDSALESLLGPQPNPPRISTWSDEKQEELYAWLDDKDNKNYGGIEARGRLPQTVNETLPAFVYGWTVKELVSALETR